MGKLIWNYCVICWIGGAIYYGFQYFADSDKREVQKYMYCILAAKDIGQYKSAEVITDKLGKFIAENKLENLTQYEFLEMRSNASNYIQSKGSISVFNSSNCQNLHGQPEITVRDIVGQ